MKGIDLKRIESNAKKIVTILQRDYSEHNKAEYRDNINSVHRRNNGDEFCILEHISGMLLSFLSSEASWGVISKNIKKAKEEGIPCLLFPLLCKSGSNINFDIGIIEEKSAIDLVREISKIKCGNRQILSQMMAFKENVKKLRDWEDKNGSVDVFYQKKLDNFKNKEMNEIVELVKNLSDSGVNNNDKLFCMGVPLVCEYLRNVGFDLPKPDRHILRIICNERLGFSTRSESSGVLMNKDVFHIFDELHKHSKLPRVEIDAVLWDYCAASPSRAVCTKTPGSNCVTCELRDYCNKPNHQAVNGNVPNSEHSFSMQSLEEGGCVINEYVSEVIVPSKIRGENVKEIGKAVFCGNHNLAAITIPEGVTLIDESAFEDCVNLKSVTIPKSITFLGRASFRECLSLKSIDIPERVTNIGIFAFYGCVSLETVTIHARKDSITFEDYDQTFPKSTKIVWKN